MIADPMPKTPDTTTPPKETVSARVRSAHLAKLKEMAEWDIRRLSEMVDFAIEYYVQAKYDEAKRDHDRRQGKRRI